MSPPGFSPCYAVAKSSMNGLTRGTATPLRKHRIRVNTLTPGWVMTERQKSLRLTPEGEQDIAQPVPASRVQPEDIAAMALWLASDDSRICSAHEHVVDGGWT